MVHSVLTLSEGLQSSLREGMGSNVLPKADKNLAKWNSWRICWVGPRPRGSEGQLCVSVIIHLFYIC